jgi:ABC-type polysaccharide/polyol phosphate transport system ATPase subunit
MFLRLGFAVAVHVNPEILLVDEVLAVGDAEFQEKCFAHIEDLRRRGVTIIIVSHDLPAVERFTDRTVLMEKGQIVADGVRPTIRHIHGCRAVGSGRRWPCGRQRCGRARGEQVTRLVQSGP